MIPMVAGFAASADAAALAGAAAALSPSFFFNDTATTEIYTLSLHDALPILAQLKGIKESGYRVVMNNEIGAGRSEEHTSELQSHSDLVCRLLLEKKKNT